MNLKYFGEKFIFPKTQINQSKGKFCHNKKVKNSWNLLK